MNLNRYLLGIVFFISVSSMFFPRITSAELRTVRSVQDAAEKKSEETGASRHVVYKNKQYRFRVSLPASWKGFSILVKEWGGSVMNDEWQMVREEKGPRIVIRHPLWTEENPRQDIPIMVFTKEQWAIVEKDGMILSAAPIGPAKIGRNKKYVFALPARYNYASPIGWEEVEKIIAENALRPY